MAAERFFLYLLAAIHPSYEELTIRLRKTKDKDVKANRVLPRPEGPALVFLGISGTFINRLLAARIFPFPLAAKHY